MCLVHIVKWNCRLSLFSGQFPSTHAHLLSHPSLWLAHQASLLAMSTLLSILRHLKHARVVLVSLILSFTLVFWYLEHSNKNLCFFLQMTQVISAGGVAAAACAVCCAGAARWGAGEHVFVSLDESSDSSFSENTT